MRWLVRPFVWVVQLLLAAWALLIVLALLGGLAVLVIHDAVDRRRAVRAWFPGGRSS
jgi:hypothetical protein